MNVEILTSEESSKPIALMIHFNLEGVEEGSIGYETFIETAEVFEECLRLVARKSQDYGSAWREQGWMGNVARIMSKSSRLKNMLWRDMPMDNAKESVEDTMLDLVNLTAFALINKRHGNRWGRS